MIVGPAAELGLVGLALLTLFILPLIIRPGWGPDGPLVQAILAALMIDALFIDIFGYRKEVWIAIGLASGLAYLARQERRGRDAATHRTSPDARTVGSSTNPRRAVPTGGRSRASAQVPPG